MPTGEQLEYFGQAVPERNLGVLAAGIASRIGDGKPAPLAGFVWYRPQGSEHEVKEALPAAA
jgi:hypothetical protein